MRVNIQTFEGDKYQNNSYNKYTQYINPKEAVLFKGEKFFNSHSSQPVIFSKIWHLSNKTIAFSLYFV
jgi:hypothetical protein